VSRRTTADALPDELMRRFELQKQTVLRTVQEQALRGLHHVNVAIRETQPHQPVDRHVYEASFSVEKTADGALLGTDCPYAPIIEYGTRPFWPPFEPLFDWAFRKFRVWGDGTAKNPDERFADAWKIAKGTQAAIARRGLQPRHVQKRALIPAKRDLARALSNLNGKPGFAKPS